MSDIYYSPAKYNLRTVGEVEFSSGGYEFDTTVVWQEFETGALYYADDAGCSCPSPFENHDRSTITRIERMQELIDHLEARKAASFDYNPDPELGQPDFVQRVDAAAADLILAAGKARDAHKEKN